MSITINTSENKVSITQDTQTLTITNNNNGNTVSIKPADNPTVTIAAPGPQGATGATGAAGSGSGVTSYSELSGIPSGIYSSSLQTLGNITSSGNISSSGTGSFHALKTDQYIYHTGDSNTLINFTDNRIRFEVGGISYLDLNDATSAPHDITFNNGGHNVDLTIKGTSNNPLFKTDASANRIGTNGKGTPEVAFHIGGDELRVDGNISGSSAIFDNNVSASKFYAADGLYHSDDVLENTHITFPTGDKVQITAGDVNFIHAHQVDADINKLTFNDDNTDTDIIFRGAVGSNNNLLRLDASEMNIGMGTGVPSASLHLVGNLWVSGSNGHITSSGNISASGTTSTTQVIIPSQQQAVKIFNKTALGNTEEQLNIGKDANWTSIEYGRGDTSKHEFLGHITASGGISSSGTGSFGMLIVDQNITASGNISSSGGTVTALSGSFSHILGNSPITIQDPTTFQSSITASGDISASQVFEGTTYTWEIAAQIDTNDDNNWHGPPNTGLLTATAWEKDFGTVYDDNSTTIVEARTRIPGGWRIPHSANYSCSIKSMDIYLGGRTNTLVDATDHISCSLWYSKASDINERTNQSSTSGFTQRHGATVLTTQVGQTLVKFNQYHLSQSINLDLAPGAMLYPRVKSADGSSQNILYDIYWIVNYCKIPL